MLCIAAVSLHAKADVKTVEGEAYFYVPSNMPLAQGKEEAIRRAKVDALNRAFGNTIGLSNTSVSSSDGDERFYSHGFDFVKGEWLENIGKPEITTNLDGDEILVICKIKGKARAKEMADISLAIKMLRNGTTPDCQATEFHAGNKMYMSFRTPVDGYVCVYQYDPKADAAFCLLPYRRDGAGSFKVEHDKDYVFFSKANSDNPRITDEYRLGCEEDGETNTIYVVFSTNEFTKSLTDGDDRRTPGSINFDTFTKWTAKCRAQDAKLQVIPLNIIIRK